MSAVALDDCTSAVTPSPARNAETRLATLLREDAAQVRAEDAQDAGAHDVRAPDQQGDAGQQVKECLHSYTLPGRLKVLRLVKLLIASCTPSL